MLLDKIERVGTRAIGLVGMECVGRHCQAPTAVGWKAAVRRSHAAIVALGGGRVNPRIGEAVALACPGCANRCVVAHEPHDCDGLRPGPTPI